MTEARWCYYCGVAGPGWHDADGRFDPTSVEVTEGEMYLAMQRNTHRRSLPVVHWNIAFGKHLGMYDPFPKREDEAAILNMHPKAFR